MTRLNLVNASEPTRTPADRLLLQLKTRGPLTATELGAALRTTGEAARQQLVRLAAEGLVVSSNEVRGVGRPAQVWTLTADGHRRFPDTHAELTVGLIRTIRTVLGEESLDRLIAAREAETRELYAEALEGVDTSEERVARLAEIRTREGYMAEWRREGDDFLLIENHCPICAAAAVCQGFCAAELSVFQDTLGPEVRVERVEHIQAGARRCAYRVTPAAVEGAAVGE
ncbi:MAG: putative transcriptional regulator [Armatimonadetes bacterium]|jgi:predicted ArsR family transcriptional regulator|nr:putative transcriptional regulator [Armatimonadota bacterium]